jgi:hypothetical protein
MYVYSRIYKWNIDRTSIKLLIKTAVVDEDEVIDAPTLPHKEDA